MIEKLIVGVFKDYREARGVVDELVRSGFNPQKISLFASEEDELRMLAVPSDTGMPDKALVVCAIIGTAIGILGGFMVPVTNIASSSAIVTPLLGAFFGGTGGLCIGLIYGAIFHFDRPILKTGLHNISLPNGKVMIAIRTDQRDERYRAEEILDDGGAIDIDIKTEEHAA